jgi:hypothetical protein
MQTYSQRCSCPKKHSKNTDWNIFFPLIPGLFIALIPKCPFCILSYTSAITVCSSKSISGYSPHWTSWISIFFSLITLIITFYNYKGLRTQIACLLILIGGILIVYSELFTRLLPSYYWGCAILIFGVWVNGSLLFFLRLILPLKNLSFKHAWLK